MDRKTVKFPDPDALLMLKFKEGDIESFEKLMEKYQKLAINTAYRLIGDKTEAEDMLTVQSRMHSYSLDSRLRGNDKQELLN